MDKEIDEVETEVVEEQPVISLIGYETYGTFGPEDYVVDIFIDDVKKSKIGDRWATRGVGSIRAAQEQEAEVVYKTSEGAAILITTRHWADTPDGDEDVHRKLVWISYGKAEGD
ncbi:MAG: hypothetical protein QXU98_07295 [Candidatus Parvarchaeota archaeon]